MPAAQNRAAIDAGASRSSAHLWGAGKWVKVVASDSPVCIKAFCYSSTHIPRSCRSLQPGQSSLCAGMPSRSSTQVSRTGKWVKVAASDSPDH